MAYHPDQKAEFRIFNKNEMKWEENIFTADPMVNIHHINAYEENSKIIFDTMVASNGDTISLFEYANLNSTGPILMEQFKKVAPVGTATRFVLDLGKLQRFFFILPSGGFLLKYATTNLNIKTIKRAMFKPK